MRIFLSGILFLLLTEAGALYCAEEAAVSQAPAGESAAAAPEDADDTAQERQLPPLEPGDWEPLLELGESIYPSAVISTATLKGGLWDDDRHIGDPWGVIGVVVRGTGKDCPVRVEITGGGFVRPSVFVGTLPAADVVYCIYPDLNYDYEKLLAVNQTVPEKLVFRVTIGGTVMPEKTVHVQVRPVNECVFNFVDSTGNMNDVSFLFAAYVNENHPFISQIMKEALAAGRVDSFEGYQGDAESVRQEIGAIWETLRQRGVRYSTMTASADDDSPYIGTQYVRLIGESINYSQANCVDGSVLMASILRKIGLDVSLVKLPEHMFIAVSIDKEGKEIVCIETTVLGQDDIDEAIDDGNGQYAEHKEKFESDKDEDEEYGFINIQSARVLGIMPIKDAAAE